MCEMISPKECFLQMIETSVGWDVFLCNLLFLSYFSWAFLFSEDVLRCIEACPRDGIRFPWSRMSTITIMSFLSYRDAVQLHDKLLKTTSPNAPMRKGARHYYKHSDSHQVLHLQTTSKKVVQSESDSESEADDVTARLSIYLGTPRAAAPSRASTAEHLSHEADSMARAKQSLCDHGALSDLDSTSFAGAMHIRRIAQTSSKHTDDLLACTRATARIYSTADELL
jgi:hypothetical protein